MSGSPDALLRPRSIAVIGEGRKRGSISAEVFHNPVHVGSQRAVYPVNTKAPRVQSMRSYASVEEIPDPVDLAVPARGYGMREAYLATLGRRTELGRAGAMRGVLLQRMADKGIETFVGAAEAAQMAMASGRLRCSKGFAAARWWASARSRRCCFAWAASRPTFHTSRKST